MDPTQFAIQAVRHDERQKVGAKLREICDTPAINDPAIREFVFRHGLSSVSSIQDVIRAVAAEVESWPIPEN